MYIHIYLMFDVHFWVNLYLLYEIFAQLPAAYVIGGHIFSLQHYNRQQHKTSWFFSLNRRLKECVLDRRGDCHCLPVWLCSHNKNTGSKWTTKHPLSGPARLTRIYWATRRNEEEIFLTPTAEKGTERKFNNTLCDQPPHCTGGEPFRHTIFCHYRNLITHFSIFFLFIFQFSPSTSIFVCHLSVTWYTLCQLCSQHRGGDGGQWMVDTSHSSALSISVPCPKPWCQTAKMEPACVVC